MEKFISFEKLSKKKKKELNSKKRKSWNGASPVTKRSENKKRYNRNKSRIRDDEFEYGIYYLPKISTLIHFNQFKFLHSCGFPVKLLHTLNLVAYGL